MKRPWGNKRSEPPQRRRLSAEQLAEQKQAGKRGQSLFRRNRTLVGSLSANVSSASELTGDLRSPRAHVHHLTAHRRMLTTVLVVVAGGILLLTWLLYQLSAGIHVSPSPSVVINESRYQNAINDYFALHPIERLRFALNNDGLTKYLAQTVPEVVEAREDGSAGFATGQFDLTFRRPVVGWLIGTNQYYVDDSGVSFQVNYFDQPAVKIIDNSGVPQTAGTTIASSRFLSFVGRTVTLAKASNLEINQAIIPAGTTHQIEVMVKGHSYPIKLSLDRPVGEQVEDMQRAVSFFDSQQLHPEYVDVRVSNKAYYK